MDLISLGFTWIIIFVFFVPLVILAGVLASIFLRMVVAIIAIPILTTYYWIKDRLGWTTNAL